MRQEQRRTDPATSAVAGSQEAGVADGASAVALASPPSGSSVRKSFWVRLRAWRVDVAVIVALLTTWGTR